MLNRSRYRFEKHKKRETSFLKTIKKCNWSIKTYGIRLKNLLNDNIKEFILGKLPRPTLIENRYGIGFLIIHQEAYTSENDNFNTINPVQDSKYKDQNLVSK